MNHRIKMIGMDLDGTLLTNKKELLPYTRSVLKKAIDAGIEVVVATGRPYNGVPKELKEFEGIHYALTSNGGRIVEIETGEALKEILIPQDKAEEILHIFENYDTIPELHCHGQSYLNIGQLPELKETITSPYAMQYILDSRQMVSSLWEILEANPGGLDKVRAFFKSKEEQRKARERILELGGVEVVSSVEEDLEVNAAGVDKGKGMCALGEELGIKPEEILAFGDNENDCEMLRMCGIGVAVADAINAAKEAADLIARSNEEEGVAHMIDHLVFGEEE